MEIDGRKSNEAQPLNYHVGKVAKISNDRPGYPNTKWDIRGLEFKIVIAAVILSLIGLVIAWFWSMFPFPPGG